MNIWSHIKKYYVHSLYHEYIAIRLESTAKKANGVFALDKINFEKQPRSQPVSDRTRADQRRGRSNFGNLPPPTLVGTPSWDSRQSQIAWRGTPTACSTMQLLRSLLIVHGSLNVPIEHHPTIRYMVYNGYYKVMSNVPKWDSYQPLLLSISWTCGEMFVPRHGKIKGEPWKGAGDRCQYGGFFLCRMTRETVVQRNIIIIPCS